MLHSSTVDPFKLALYKLMGKIEPSRRTAGYDYDGRLFVVPIGYGKSVFYLPLN
jgi:hypothetical protein